MLDHHAALDRLFYPARVALVGVSPDPTRYNGRPLVILQEQGFAGEILPVNPRHESMAGLRCYASVSAAGPNVDLAVVMVGGRRTVEVLRDCGEAGVGAALVMSAGFGELGDSGKAAEREMTKIVHETGLRILGPNSAGMLCPLSRTVVTLLSAARRPLRPNGSVGLIAQSGTACGACLTLGQERGLAFTHAISTGNEVDIGAADLLEYLVEDDNTRVILLYLEEIRDGHRFLDASERALRLGKSIVCLRPGRSAVARASVLSHTGALAGSDAAYEALFRRAGITRVDDFDKLIDAGVALNPSRPARGDRAFVLTVGSGGGAAVAADLCDGLGLSLPAPSRQLTERMKRLVSPLVTVRNPLDAAGVSGEVDDEPRMMSDCLSAVVESGEFDQAVVFVPGIPYAEQVARKLVEQAAQAAIPILSVWSGGNSLTPAMELAAAGGVPAFRSLSTCLAAARWLVDRGTHARQEPRSLTLVDSQRRARALELIGGRSGTLDEWTSRRLLRIYGIQAPREVLVHSTQDAVSAAREIGHPVAVKLTASRLTHKSELGAVQLDLRSDSEIRAAVDGMHRRVSSAQIDVEGVLIQEMITGGLELLVGVVIDSPFGPVVLAGAGGIHAELLRDRSVRLAPLTRDDAASMLADLRLSALFEGARGLPATDTGAVIDALCGLSSLALELSDVLVEVDVNPLRARASGNGAIALDSLVVVREEGGRREPAATRP
jgi:acyl-CoA synthetase (NDP forming)